MWATRTLLHFVAVLLLFSTTTLASPATPGGPALFARRNHAAAARSNNDGNAVAAPQTNAARFARGLTPLKPNNLFNPTRVRRQTPSDSPTLSGSIAVYQAGTKTLRGYINPAAVTPSIVSSPPALKFTYTPPVAAGNAVELNYVGQPNRMAIGATSGVPSLLGSSSNSARFLSTSASIPAGSTPQRESTSSARYVETTVWFIDPNTNGVTAAFVNYDGSRPSTAFIQQGAYLYITGNASQFIKLASGAVEVDLVFVPS